MTRGARGLVLAVVLTALLAVGVVLSSMLGQLAISPTEVIGSLLRGAGIPNAWAPTDPIVEATLWVVRFPRILMGLAVGAALAVAGAVMQAIFGNPLAEPGVTVVAALASGGGTLRGATTVLTDADGIARFTDLALEGPDGPHTLIFAAVGLTSVAAPQIVVRADPVPAASIEITEHTPETTDVGRSVFFRVRISPEPSGQPPDSSFFLNASTGESCRGSIFDRTCGLIFNSPGERTIVATLPAVDGRPEVASSPVRHVVNEVEGPTRTSVGVTPDPARSNQRLTVFVKVVGEGGEGAKGSVVLYLDGGGCGRGELLGQIFELNSNGEGTFRIGPLDPGYHEVRGCYTGALGFAPSEDLASVTVNP